MSVKKFVVGNFDDEAVLFPAIKKVRRSGYKIHDVFTPFPIHGLDKAMGLRDTSLHTAGFIYAHYRNDDCAWLYYLVAHGRLAVEHRGKAIFLLPAWIPITFELTVLFSSIGMVLTFCYLCQIAPFVKKDHFNPRSTDDTFVMVWSVRINQTNEELVSFMQSLGAKDASVQYRETGWWLGRYDKDTKRFEEKGDHRSLILTIDEKVLGHIGFFVHRHLLVSCSKTRRSTGRAYMPDMYYSRAYETYASQEELEKARHSLYFDAGSGNDRQRRNESII